MEQRFYTVRPYRYAVTYMRVVFDTNVLIDAFSDAYSAPARLLAATREGQITALLTRPVEREYRLILRRLIADPAYQTQIEDFLQQAEMVSPQRVDVEIDDPEDYKILQAAIGGGADLVVTQDRHLLTLGEVNGVKIVTPPEAWAHYEDESDTGSSAWQEFARGLGIGR